ncbi:MAG TPA: nucleotidyltransferase domain-containing protein [Methanocorpusculum sp.]|nr:nucleotidyltransferase domain-containing protein [Methanocorpusculum sp.]
MCSESELAEILKEVRIEAETVFQDSLDAVILYGSYAQKTAHAESDIDVMIRVNLSKAELDRYMIPISVFASRLGLKHDVVISIHLQDSETFDAWKDILPFYQNVVRYGVSV